MSYEMIALTMFASMMLMLMTGQRVFAAIGFVEAVFIDRGDDGRESERFSGNATYELARRSMIYFRWNRNDLTGFGGTFFGTEFDALELLVGCAP